MDFETFIESAFQISICRNHFSNWYDLGTGKGFAAKSIAGIGMKTRARVSEPRH
ncbi:hypothetical protein ACF3DV_02470 [Chlorogloeopsis fritschii PCC 9212]|uniref:hypothetical protein n=1 Tax=Chlorogloeopsis fritschii TaxID=1124 RepID=UPI00138B1AD2|nr:hypothetical protein [Chlorogloeopsis fritschii]